MHPVLDCTRRWYRQYIRALLYAGDLLLLVVRLYWGWHLAESGWYKFANLTQTSVYFQNLGIFWPKLSVVVSGSTELVCGSLLIIGLSSRIAAVPMLFNMIVAYIANSGAAIRHILVNANDFLTAPEFLFLFACLLVLVFGPGMISVDGLLSIFRGHLPADGPSARAPGNDGGGATIAQGTRNRREFAKLTAAAFAGLLAGVLVEIGRSRSKVGEKSTKTDGPTQSAPKGNKEISQPAIAHSDAPKLPPPPSGTDLNLLLAGEPHTCRGLNTCRGKDKKHSNSCAGRGTCATAESHACNGQNVCKGQGGCDISAGINTCKGKGACAVPLKDATWKLARARFEQLAKAKNLAIGPAPAKS